MSQTQVTIADGAQQRSVLRSPETVGKSEVRNGVLITPVFLLLVGWYLGLTLRRSGVVGSSRNTDRPLSMLDRSNGGCELSHCGLYLWRKPGKEKASRVFRSIAAGDAKLETTSRPMQRTRRAVSTAILFTRLYTVR